MDVEPMPEMPPREAFSAVATVNRVSLPQDERWRWTGTQWVATAAPRPHMPFRTVAFGALWLVSLCLWLPLGLDVMRADSASWDVVSVALVAGLLLPFPSTLAWGAHLGRTSRWAVATASVPVGGLVLLCAYVLAFVLGPDSNADQEAGAGVAILGIPTLLALAAILFAGAGVGVAWRRARTPPA